MTALTFNNLTPDMARAMLDYYETLTTGDEPTRKTLITEAPLKPEAPVAATPAPVDVSFNPPPVAAPTPVDMTSLSPAATADGELDASGIPFNADFHSEKRVQTAKGQWRMKRGADKDAYAEWVKTIVNAKIADMQAASVPTAPTVMPDFEMPGTVMPPAPVVAAPSYETQVLPMWKALHEINCLPIAHIEMIMDENGFKDDYPAIVKNDNLRALLYARLEETVDQLSDTQRQQVILRQRELAAAAAG